MNYQAYCTAIKEQVAVHIQLLGKMSEKDDLDFLERTAAERSLQVVAESVIGVSKQASRKLGLPERSDAANIATQLLEQHPCPGITKEEIRGAIGMRNVIVHDYLNLDWRLVQKVITNRQYLKLEEFVSHCCRLLKDSQ